MVQQGKRIKKYSYLLLISLFSIGLDVALYFLYEKFKFTSWINLRTVAIILMIYRIVLTSTLTKFILNSLNKALIEKYKIYHILLGIFILPEIFIWVFRFYYSMAVFEAESSPNYVNSIKPLSMKKNALKTDVTPPTSYQFNSQEEKLAKLEELKSKGLIKEKEYQELKDYIMQPSELNNSNS